MKDILTELDHDLSVINGDFSIGESGPYHSEYIMLAEYNEFKMSPDNGLCPNQYINGVMNNKTEELLNQRCKSKLKNDGLDDNVDIVYDNSNRTLTIKSYQS